MIVHEPLTDAELDALERSGNGDAVNRLVWQIREHRRERAGLAAALSTANARIAELEREREGLAERIRREKKTVESTDALVKQAAIAALEHAAALVEQAGENSNVKGVK